MYRMGNKTFSFKQKDAQTVAERLSAIIGGWLWWNDVEVHSDGVLFIAHLYRNGNIVIGHYRRDKLAAIVALMEQVARNER